MFQGCQIVIKVLKYLLSVCALISLQTDKFTNWNQFTGHTLRIIVFHDSLGLSNLSSSLSQPEGYSFGVILFSLMDTIFFKIQNSQYFNHISNKSPHAPHNWPRHTGLWTPQRTGVAADLHTSIKSTIFHSIVNLHSLLNWYVVLNIHSVIEPFRSSTGILRPCPE